MDRQYGLGLNILRTTTHLGAAPVVLLSQVTQVVTAVHVNIKRQNVTAEVVEETWSLPQCNTTLRSKTLRVAT